MLECVSVRTYIGECVHLGVRTKLAGISMSSTFAIQLIITDYLQPINQ